MKNKILTELENKAKELFGEKSTVSVAEIKVANKGYIVRIKMQGMPFEISAMRESLEEAQTTAVNEFNKYANDAIENSLFTTQPVEKYETEKLTDEQFDKLFKYEEPMNKEYIEELKEKTYAKICKLSDGRYECVIKSPYMCLNARGTAVTKELAIWSATMVAHDIFNPSLEYVGRKPWDK